MDERACRGCGRVDPCGVHYPHCSLLDEGDFVIHPGDEPSYDPPRYEIGRTLEGQWCVLDARGNLLAAADTIRKALRQECLLDEEA
jgi:hypothetical protein